MVVSSMAHAMTETEIKQKISFSNAIKILIDRCGYGEAVAIDVVVEMARAMNFSMSLDDFGNENQEGAISNFTDSLAIELEAENKQLLEKVNILQEQKEAILSQNQDYEHLLEESHAIIAQLKANEECIDNIAKKTSDGVKNGHHLLDGNRKILVIGQQAVGTDKLLGIVKQYGYEKRDFVFWDDYDKIKSYAERLVGGSFAGIIAGPMPHKVTGLGDYSSLIEKMKQPGYPHMEEARSENGELKITKNSFRKALSGMTEHLLAIQ